MSVLLDEDTLILEDTEHVPVCEQPQGCDEPAVARFIVLCECRKMRLGCTTHIAETVKRFENHRLTCVACRVTDPDYRVVPL